MPPLFPGGGIFPVPDDFSSQIPTIAYKIPDLEAVATLRLTDIDGEQVVGCVQATLSNGHSARQSGVLWATVGLALLALFSSLLHSVIAQSVGAAQWRLVDVMLAIQHPAVASLLSLNYPIVFLEYGTNFAWSLGLVDIPSLQDSITATRAATGGHDRAVFGSNLTAQTASRLNPYSVNGEGSSTGGGSSSLGSLGLRRGLSSLARRITLHPSSSHATVASPLLQARQEYAPNTGPGGSLITGGDSVALPIITRNPDDRGGIATFVERLNIAPGNTFLTVLVSIAALLAILVAALLVVLAIAFVARLAVRRRSSGPVGRSVSHWSDRVTTPSDFLGTITLATAGRFLLFTFPVVVLFAFYQWAHGDSWVGHLLAAISVVVFLAAAAGLLVPMVRHARRGEDLYYHDTPPARGSAVAKRWGQMAHMYRPRFYWFAGVWLAYSIVRACFIAFAQGRGTRQAIGLLVLELLVFIALCVLRVGRDKKSDFVFIFLCFSRVAAWAVCIAFIPSANVETIPRVVVGFVLLVVTAVPIIFLFFLTLWDLVTPLFRRNRRAVNHHDEKAATSADTMSEQSSSVQRP